MMFRKPCTRIAIVALTVLVVAASAPAQAKIIAVGLRALVHRFATERIGQQIGDGTCWALAHDALDHANAKRPGQELPTYVFGHEISLSSANIGDILQFEGVTFVSANGSWQNFGHHTAIVDRREGQTIYLLHQNVNGNRTVQRGSINLDERRGGTITAFRADHR